MNNIKQIRLSKNDFIVDYDTSSLKLNYKNEDNRYVIDISQMNLINATKIAILCSTYCFLNNFKKKLCWLVKDEETRQAISILRLKNIEQQIATNITEERTALISWNY